MNPTRTVIPISSLLAVVALTGACQVASADDGPFGPIHVATNRGRYSGGGCPIEVIFTASINFVMPHPQGFVFNYHWERSDGAKGPVNVVRPSSAQNMVVVKDAWTLGAAGQHYEVSVKLFVNSGETHLEQTSQVVPLTCK